MSLIVKICGLREEASLDAALDAGADMVGFVFMEASPRHVDFGTASRLGARVGGRARKVALTVDADDALLATVIEALEPDYLQLHGDETPERVSVVRSRFGLPVIRALAISGPDDLARIATYDTVADQLLFDARPPAGATRPGGHGQAFDWSLLRGFRTRRPWLLAGGLHPGNLAAALAATSAPGLDVSSGVETAPGRKDPDKIRRFVADARACHAAASALPLDRASG